MKTVQLDLEKDKELDTLSSLMSENDIKLGEETFNLRIFLSHSLSDMLYASVLLLLTKYFSELIKNKNFKTKTGLNYDREIADNIFHYYFNTFDINKLESKIEEEFRVDIEIERKDPIEEVFGIWNDNKVTLEELRKKAWQRNS